MGSLRSTVSRITQPLLSVVVPVYNGEKYLEATLDSILNIGCYENDCYEMELLLIDDGSADGSPQICARYLQSDKRVRYLRQENSGIVSARNRGLAEALGKYVCFCDQDDLVEPQEYARLVKRLEATEADLGLCATGRLINGQKSPYEKIVDGEYREQEIKRNLLYPLLFRGYDYEFAQSPNYLYGTIWKCIFNRSFLLKSNITFKCFVNYEDDWIFVTETLCAAKKVVTDSRIGYYWRVNNASKSHSCQFVEKILPKIRAYDAYTENYLAGGGIDPNVLKEYCRVRLCENIVLLYQNEAGIAKQDREKRRNYHTEVRTYLASVNYRDSLQSAKHVKKGMVRKTAVLWALGRLGVENAFRVSRAVDQLEKTLTRIPWIAKLERNLKMRKN